MTQRRWLALAVGVLGVAVLTAAFFLLQPTPSSDRDQVASTPTVSRSASSTPTPTPTPTPNPTPPPAAPEAPPPPPAPECVDDVLTCVNIARAENGLGPLSASATLNGAAQACVDRMAASGQLTHSTDHPGGYSVWGENIAAGYPSAVAVFDGWMASDGHRGNILNPSYTEMGIAYAGSGNWWCQQFGG